MTSESRFTSQNKTTQQRISNNTVGLVALSDFRKRRAEVLEQQEREAREAAIAGSPATSTPDRSLTNTPDNANASANASASDTATPARKKKKRKAGGTKLSFADDDDVNEDEGRVEQEKGGKQKEGKSAGVNIGLIRSRGSGGDDDDDTEDGDMDRTKTHGKTKFKANASVSVVPRSVTKSALRREAAEREALRRQFLARQERVKATEIALPFVFYDGSNLPGGTVRVKKGDFVWQFLDKSRKVGADLGVGEKANARREWARVGVDDLIMVRGNVIIPHHYDFLFFIMNKTLGPNGSVLFNYDAEAPRPVQPTTDREPASPPHAALSSAGLQAPVDSLEGASDDPTLTRVVDRRWYERNKHIYPASMWQDFDPEKDYQKEVRRDLGGNTFFYS
ncbi:XAP5-domain-containing protein [Nemania sp. FL0916]|nr:XAP5-domain-containing protein [Nemania sp. FL0916]